MTVETHGSARILLACAALCALPALGHAGERTLARTDTQRVFELEPGARPRLVVDNVLGRISVRSHEARRIELRLERTVYGRSADRLERADREVKLEVAAEGGLVDLYVDGPFRHPTRREWSRVWSDPGYRVVYDFDLTIPRETDLVLKTVDGGTLTVDGVHGSFEVNNVNGGIEMTAVGGSGTVEAVNGPVRVEFVSNPTADSRFVTVNGDVDIEFAAGLDADLDLHSTFGELWSEFEVRPLAARPPVERVEGGKRVIRTDSGARVRVGDGGPTLSFKTLNGDVLVRRADGRADLEETP